MQGQRDLHTKVRKLWTVACHHQSPLPKETGSRKQSKDIAHTSTQSTYNQTSQQEPSPHSIEKRIQEVVKQSSTPQNTNIEEPMEVSTKQPKQTARNSIAKKNTNAWTKPFVPSITSYVREEDKTVPFWTIGQAIPSSHGLHVQTGSSASATNCPTNYIKLVHWNAQGAITKTSAIKTAIIQDDIDIVMIQDTRYKRRLDNFPNLKIYGYHTNHRTMDEGGHGMATLIKHTILSEEEEQIHLGDGTETLSTRSWLNNKPLLLYNIYRVEGEQLQLLENQDQ